MAAPLHYVTCDVPEGMTLREYRARRSGGHAARRGVLARLWPRRRTRRPR